MTFTVLEEFHIISRLWPNAREHVSTTACVLLLTGSLAKLCSPAGSWHQSTSYLLRKLELLLTITWIGPVWVSVISQCVRWVNNFACIL